MSLVDGFVINFDSYSGRFFMKSLASLMTACPRPPKVFATNKAFLGILSTKQMQNDELLIAKALQNNSFRWLLTKYLSSDIDWRSVASKCVGQNNEYCAKMIKSKTWTDKSVPGGSLHEKMEYLIRYLATKSVTAQMLAMNVAPVGISFYAIANIDKTRKISSFAHYVISKHIEIVKEVCELYGCPWKMIDKIGTDVVGCDAVGFYTKVNRDDFHRELGHRAFTSECFLLPSTEYSSDPVNINAGFMLWDYLINDELEYPNLSPTIPQFTKLRAWKIEDLSQYFA